MSERDGTSSARRRRERRLRSWLRHERMTVAMALAEAHHHSAPKVGAFSHVVPRELKTASAVAARPGCLQDPEPQGRAVTVGYVAAPVPSVTPPALAVPAAEAVDSRALTFLLGRALEVQREEAQREVEREKETAKVLKENAVKLVQEMQALDAKISAHLPASKEEWKLWRSLSQSRPQLSSSSSSGAKKKRKKKRRKRKRRPPPPASRRT